FLSFSFFFFMLCRPPSSTLFPYTTLFRSIAFCRQRRLCRAARNYTRRRETECHRSCSGWQEWTAQPLRAYSKRACFGSPDRSCPDRKSTRLNSSHVAISYAVFCLKKKKKK